jgi:hypothetical protein
MTWYSIQTITDAMLVHASKPTAQVYQHSIQYVVCYVIEVFSVLPVNKIINTPGEPVIHYIFSTRNVVALVSP